MRITAGDFRGRKLYVPDTPNTRPTMDRTRQAVFNILRSAQWALGSDGRPLLSDAYVCDIFAGSGAMGFEALSQGAAFCTFADSAKLAVQAIEKNVIAMQLQNRTRVISGDALKLPPASHRCAVTFLDPPYRSGLLSAMLPILQKQGYVDRATLLVLEMEKGEGIEGLAVLDARIYGTSKIIFARPG